jgi:hypothetical protein
MGGEDDGYEYFCSFLREELDERKIRRAAFEALRQLAKMFGIDPMRVRVEQERKQNNH